MATLLPEVQLQVLVWSLQPVADLGRGGGGGGCKCTPIWRLVKVTDVCCTTVLVSSARQVTLNFKTQVRRVS